ncbi:hypothetical protein CR513_15416, partial [Mucuna pruriens]
MQVGQLADIGITITGSQLSSAATGQRHYIAISNQTVSARRSETNEDLLKLFRKVPKYLKILKKLYIHKRKKIKGAIETREIVLALVKHEDSNAGKCQDPGIFFVPCTIGNYTFTDAMLDLGASINVMPTSVYKSLNLGDLDSTGIEIQLANRSVFSHGQLCMEALHANSEDRHHVRVYPEADLKTDDDSYPKLDPSWYRKTDSTLARFKHVQM